VSVPEPAVELVAAAVADHHVVAVAAVERVVPAPADEVVVAGAAVDGQRLDGERGGEHAVVAAERVDLDAAVADGRVGRGGWR
jgi:hypothetical protein